MWLNHLECRHLGGPRGATQRYSTWLPSATTVAARLGYWSLSVAPINWAARDSEGSVAIFIPSNPNQYCYSVDPVKKTLSAKKVSVIFLCHLIDV